MKELLLEKITVPLVVYFLTTVVLPGLIAAFSYFNGVRRGKELEQERQQQSEDDDPHDPYVGPPPAI